MNVQEKPVQAGVEVDAELQLDGKLTKMPVRHGTLGPSVVDVGAV